MARRTVKLELSCPSRVTAGEDVTAVVELSSGEPLEVVDANVRWVTRLSVHRRVWTYRPSHYAVGWSEESRVHQEEVVSSAAVKPLIGTHPGRAVQAQVRLETVGVAASALMLPGFGDVSHFVEVQVQFSDGSDAIERNRVFVRPRRPGPLDLAAMPPPVPSSFEASLHLRQGDEPGPLYGQFYREIEGVALLGGGPVSLGPGRFRAELVCSAMWPVHYLKPTRPDPPADWTLRRELREETMERQTTETSMSLPSQATPPVPAGAQIALPFSWKGPKSTAQTTETAEGTIAWRVDARWEADDQQATSSVPITMSLAPADPTAPAGRGLLRALRLGRKAGGAGTGAD